jgi:hypothetical protein
MATMQDVRQKYPQYHDMSDDDLAGAIHQKFYSDIPYEEFTKEIGLASRSWSDVPGEAWSNIPSSAINVAKSVYDTVRHPMETVGRMNDAVEGAANKIQLPGFVKDAGDYVNDNLVPSFQQKPERTPEDLARMDSTANAVGQNFKDRYWGWDNIKKTLATDPVGSALDVATLATGVAGVAGRGPMALRATNVAKIPGQTRISEALLRKAVPKDTAPFNRLGPEAMLLDASPSMTGLAQGVSVPPGKYKNLISEALMNRDKGRSTRLLSDTESTLGKARDPDQLKNVLQKAATRQSGPTYRAAITNAPHLDKNVLGPILDTQFNSNALTSTGERTVSAIRKEIDRALDAPTPQLAVERLWNIRKELDSQTVHGREEFAALSSADKVTQASLKEARAAVDEILKDRVPGMAQGDAIVHRSKGMQDDIDFGRNALEGGKYATTPERLRADLNKRNPKMVGEGIKADIRTSMGTQANDLAALRKKIGGDNDFNRDKLATVFGQEKVERLLNAVDREATFAQNSSDILRNSQTAQRQGAARALETAEPRISGQETLTGLGLKGAGKAISSLLTKAKIKSSQSTRDALVQALMTRGPEATKLLDALSQTESGRTLRKIARALITVHAAEGVNQATR